MKLSDYAKQVGVTYKTAYQWCIEQAETTAETT